MILSTSSAIWLSVMKICASSCVKARTRISPCSAPDGSKRCTLPNSAIFSGRSRYDLQPVLEDLDVARAVHRLDGVDALVLLALGGEEHHVVVGRDVAGGDPQLACPCSCGEFTSTKPDSCWRRRM